MGQGQVLLLMSPEKLQRRWPFPLGREKSMKQARRKKKQENLRTAYTQAFPRPQLVQLPE